MRAAHPDEKGNRCESGSTAITVFCAALQQTAIERCLEKALQPGRFARTIRQETCHADRIISLPGKWGKLTKCEAAQPYSLLTAPFLPERRFFTCFMGNGVGKRGEGRTFEKTVRMEETRTARCISNKKRAQGKREESRTFKKPVRVEEARTARGMQ